MYLQANAPFSRGRSKSGQLSGARAGVRAIHKEAKSIRKGQGWCSGQEEEPQAVVVGRHAAWAIERAGSGHVEAVIGLLGRTDSDAKGLSRLAGIAVEHRN